MKGKIYVLSEAFISVSSMCLSVPFFFAVIPQTQCESRSMTAISTHTVLQPKRLLGTVHLHKEEHTLQCVYVNWGYLDSHCVFFNHGIDYYKLCVFIEYINIHSHTDYTVIVILLHLLVNI